jgi:hypothetical protein
VTFLTTASTAVKPVLGNDSGSRDLLVSALRVGSARARLIANELDTIQASVRQRAISCEDALIWAKEKDVMDWIQFGPSEPRGERHWRSPGWDKAREEYHANRRST